MLSMYLKSLVSFRNPFIPFNKKFCEFVLAMNLVILNYPRDQNIS